MKQFLIGTMLVIPTSLFMCSYADADMYYASYSRVNHNDSPWPYIGEGGTLSSFEYTWDDGSFVSGNESGMNVSSIGGNGYVGAYISFGVDEDSSFTLNRTSYEGYFNFEFYDSLTGEILYLDDGDTINLYAEGPEMRYYINTTTLADWSFTGSAIPAPSALALLGLAGVATKRRRR